MIHMIIQPVDLEVYDEDKEMDFMLSSTREYYTSLADIVQEELRIFKEEDDDSEKSRLDKIKEILEKLWKQIIEYFRKFRNWLALQCPQFEKQLKLVSPIVDLYYDKVKLKGYPNICRRTELGRRFAEMYAIVYTTSSNINQEYFDYDKASQQVIDVLNNGYSIKEDSIRDILNDWLDKVVLGKPEIVKLERKDITYDVVQYYLDNCVQVMDVFLKMKDITDTRYYSDKEAKDIHKLITMDVSIVDTVFRGLMYWKSFIYEYIMECIKLYKKDHPADIKEED